MIIKHHVALLSELAGIRYTVSLDTLRLTFTANGKLLENFLFYNSIIMFFTKVLKYIKQLLNLWYLAII